MRTARRSLVAVLLLASMVVVTSPRADAQTEARPNVLVIVLDDMRADLLAAMGQTRLRFATQGEVFPQSFTVDPLCCPSRATIMTGRYLHNHQVGGNTKPDVANFDHSTTVQRYLHDAGYATAIAGKLFNPWRTELPPYFDHSAIAQPGPHEAPTFAVDGQLETFDQHDTEVTGNFAKGYVDQFEQDDDRPWYMYVATPAVHWPYTPEEQDADFPLPAWPGNPAVAETDRTDKPPAVQERHATFEQGAAVFAAQTRMAIGVDRMIGELFDELDRLGEQNTLAFFISDSGYTHGEHGVSDEKRFPYLQSIRVPFMVRWPGHITPGSSDDRLATNADITPTILGVLGIDPVYAPVDGRYLFGPYRRNHVFSEWQTDDVVPSWATILDRTYLYTEWYDANGAITFREYYDLTIDRWQLTNELSPVDPSLVGVIPALHQQLLHDRSCRGRYGPNACT